MKRSKHPIHYIKRFYQGKNCITQLGSWMIRELISYLDLDDFLSFVSTCRHLSKYTYDPYISHSPALTQCCLDVPTSDMLQQVGFLHKLRQGDWEPISEVQEDVMLQRVFYYNSRRRLLYSYYRDLLKVFKLDVLTMTPIYESSVPAIPDVLVAAGFGKQFYLANSSTLISLHEGEVEGLSYNAEVGWGVTQTGVECEEGVRLEVLEGGKIVVLALKKTVHLFNYSLTPLQTLPSLPPSLLYVPSPLAHSYILTNFNSMKVHHTNSSEPFTLPNPSFIPITKVIACKSGARQFLVYTKGTELMMNKTSLGDVNDFTTYKHHLFTYKEGRVYYSNLSLKPVGFEALPIGVASHHLWMHADNHKLVFVYSEREIYYLHLYDFKNKHSWRRSIPVNGYTQIYQREGNILIIQGYVWRRDSEVIEPRTLLYSLELSRPMTPHSRDIVVSPESAHFNTPLNFLSERNWERTGAKPLELRTKVEGDQKFQVFGFADEWSELAQKVLIRSSAQCKVVVEFDHDREWMIFYQIRVLLWKDRQLVDSHETPLHTIVRKHGSVFKRPKLEFVLAKGGFCLEVIIGCRTRTPTTTDYFRNPRLLVTYS
jgi:hypothetical protein